MLGDLLNLVGGSWGVLVLAALGAVQGLILAIIALLKIIPGDQGEMKLQSIADFLSGLIDKKKE